MSLKNKSAIVRITPSTQPIFVEEVVAGDLCTGCGVCAGTCPTNAIKMVLNKRAEHVPLIDRQNCSACNLCVEVCPGLLNMDAELNEFVFNRQPENTDVGNHLSIFVGYATDRKTRQQGSSGGLATAILGYCLEMGRIDAAIVASESHDNPLDFRGRVVHSVDEIRSAAKSKYTSVDIGGALSQLWRKNLRFAVVGLPCHIEGLRKAQMRMPKLRRNLVLTIGLFCGHNVTRFLTEFWIACSKTAVKDVRAVRYRGTGWWPSPEGGRAVEFESKNGAKTIHGWRDSAFQIGWDSKIFVPSRCFACLDFSAELADISLGDAWLDRYKDGVEGMSIGLARTHTGLEIVAAMSEEGVIDLETAGVSDFYDSNRSQIDFKKRDIWARLDIRTLLRKQNPDYPWPRNFRTSTRERLIALEQYLVNEIAVVLHRWRILQHIPLKFWRNYLYRGGPLKRAILLGRRVKQKVHKLVAATKKNSFCL